MSKPRESRRPFRRIVAGVAAVGLFGSFLALGTALPAAAAGTVLLNETFTGASVSDARAIGLNAACLTGAAAGSTPPAGSSNLSNCSAHQNGAVPPIGVTPGWLQLTDVAAGQTGGMVFDRALPSAAGIQVEFDQAQYGGSAADGIGFFLSDGSRVLSQTGALGGSLGYGQNSFTPGVAGGYLGVGLDAFGNFIGDFNGLGGGCATPSPFTSRVSNTVTLRGPGDGTVGYCMLTTTANPPTGPSTLPASLRVANPATPDAAVRNVRVTVSPDPFPLVTVQIDFTGTRTAYQTVLTYRMPAQPPATYKFGFSASTGALTDAHLIRNVAITTIDPLGAINLVKQVDNTTPQPASYGYGATIPYQFVVTNSGADAVSGIVVSDPLVTNISCPSTTLGPAGGPTSSMVCTGSHVVTGPESVQPTLTNTASVSATASTGTVTDTSSVTVPIEVSQPRLNLVKAATLNDTNGDGLASLGETINFSFVATNTGNVPLTAVGVSDPTAGPVTCTPTTLAAGGVANCTATNPHTVTEADLLAGGIVNTATGSGTPPPGVPPIVPPTDTVTTPTTIPVSGLAITKTATLNDTNGNGLADEGETISYSFLVHNTGTVTLTGVGVTDPRAGAITCPTTTLAPNATTTCTATAPYTVTLADVLAGGVVNTATGAGTPPPGVPALTPPTDTVTTPTVPVNAAMSLQKTATLDDTNGNGLADPGETIAYTFTLTNVGNMPLTGVGVTDPKAGPVTCVATTLAPGASTTCSATNPYTVTEADVLAHGVTNTATGAATPPPGVPFVPPTATVTTPTPPAVGGLAMRKSASLNDTNGNGLADIGETIDYSFLMTNTGNVTLTGVGVTDPKAGAVTCPTTTLAPGAQTTCTAAPYTVTEDDELAGGVLNTASGVSTTPPGVPAVTPPTDTVIVPTPIPGAGLALRKIDTLNDTNGNGLADVGETIDYSFVLTNTGNVTLTGVGVNDPLVGPVTCPLPTLAIGATETCTADNPYTVTEQDILNNGITNLATGVSTPPPNVDLIPPTDTITTPTAAAGGGLSLVKTATLNDANGNGLADLGETVDYTISLTNIGNVTLTDVAVNDPTAGTIDCPSTTLAPGASMDCTPAVPYTVTEADILRGSVTNVATADGTVPDGVPPINPPSGTASVPTAAPVSALSIVKNAALNDTNGNGLADPGETIDYSFTVTNTGDVTITGVAVSDLKAGAVTCPSTTLAPGTSTVCTANAPYTVVTADVEAGGVINVATATGTPPDGAPELVPPTDTITVPTPAPIGGFTLVKTAHVNDTNGDGLAGLGDTVDYSFLITNIGNVTLVGIGVSDPKVGPVTCAVTTLAPGQSVTCTARYTVTEQDVLADNLVNTATGQGAVPPGIPADPIDPPTDTVTTPTELPNAALAVTKSAHLNDANGNGWADAGETIDYSVHLDNTGNVTLSGIQINDPAAGTATCPSTSLAPGAQMVCTLPTYTVTSADVAQGDALNVVTVTATVPEGVPPLLPVQATVSVAGPPITLPAEELPNTGATLPYLATALIVAGTAIGGGLLLRLRRRGRWGLA